MRTVRWSRTAPWVAAALVLMVGAIAYPFTVDDAYIVARYAEHLSEGLGYGMNPASPSDGLTGPLWVLPPLVAIAAGFDPIETAKIVGLLATAAAAALATHAVSQRRLGGRAGVATSLLVGLQPTLGIWGVAGLETGLATLTFTVAAVESLRPRPRVSRLGLAVAVLAWLRPEMAIASGVLLLGETVRGRYANVAVALVGAGSVVAFRWVMFGHPLPLSVHAKPPMLETGLEYLLLGIVVTTGVGGLVLLVLTARHGRRRERWLCAALVGHGVALVLAGGDWMPGFRLLAPVLPAYALLAGLGVARASIHRNTAYRVATAGVALVALAVPTLDLLAQLPAARGAGRAREEGGAAVAALLRDRGRVGLVDVGYLAYTTGIEVVDLGGVTDPVIARRPGGHLSKEIAEGMLSARSPDAFVLHSSVEPIVEDGVLRGLAGYPVENRVARMSYVRDGFSVRGTVRYAPSYWYVVLVRDPPR